MHYPACCRRHNRCFGIVCHVNIPVALLKLEEQLAKPPLLHNDNKRRRHELARIQALLRAEEMKPLELLECVRIEGFKVTIELVSELSHGQQRAIATKDLTCVGPEGVHIKQHCACSNVIQKSVIYILSFSYIFTSIIDRYVYRIWQCLRFLSILHVFYLYGFEDVYKLLCAGEECVTAVSAMT